MVLGTLADQICYPIKADEKVIKAYMDGQGLNDAGDADGMKRASSSENMLALERDISETAQSSSGGSEDTFSEQH